MSWSGWYLRNSSISAILRSVIGVVTPFRLLVVLLLEGNAPVTFSVNHRPDSTGFYTLPGTLTWSTVENLGPGLGKTLLYRCQHKVHLQGVAQLPAHHVAGVPVQQRHQIQPAPREPDVGDVHAPHLVGSRDHHTPNRYGYTRCFWLRRLRLGPGCTASKPISRMWRWTALRLTSKPRRRNAAVIRREP